MELSFETEDLREVCEKRAAATSMLGVQAALELERCLADISAARTVSELEMIMPNSIAVDVSGERSIEFSPDWKILFRAGHVKVPMTDTNNVDWRKVTRIRILELRGAPGNE